MKTGKIENEAFEQGGVPRKDGRGGTSGAFARRTVRRRSRRRVVIRCRTVSIPCGIGGPQLRPCEGPHLASLRKLRPEYACAQVRRAAICCRMVRFRKGSAGRSLPLAEARISRPHHARAPQASTRETIAERFRSCKGSAGRSFALRRSAFGVPSQAAPRMVRPRKRSAARSRPLAEGCNSRELVASLSARLRAFDIAAAGLLSGTEPPPCFRAKAKRVSGVRAPCCDRSTSPRRSRRAAARTRGSRRAIRRSCRSRSPSPAAGAAPSRRGSP